MAKGGKRLRGKTEDWVGGNSKPRLALDVLELSELAGCNTWGRSGRGYRKLQGLSPEYVDVSIWLEITVTQNNGISEIFLYMRNALKVFRNS